MKTIELSTELLNTQTAGLDAALVEKIKADFAPYFNDNTNLDKLQAKIKKILLELPKGETDTANAVVKQVQQFLKDAVSIIDEHILPF